jgi:hypothetical protein
MDRGWSRSARSETKRSPAIAVTYKCSQSTFQKCKYYRKLKLLSHFRDDETPAPSDIEAVVRFGGESVPAADFTSCGRRLQLRETLEQRGGVGSTILSKHVTPYLRVCLVWCCLRPLSAQGSCAAAGVVHSS